jgi:hypothetical protein
VAGKPEASEIVRRVTTDDAEARMPADADPLPAEERAILASWVSAGAPWPDDMATLPPSLFPDTRETSSHWAFQPIVRPPLPEIARVTHPIDAFVLQGLAAQGLSMQPEAAPPTLLRRVMFDLVGLPPTPADVQAFTADVAARGTDAAFGDLVDRLLASHGFGERWARHWLDAVRFAESNGFEMNQMRPNAWRYRDWVIESLKCDLPYDAFVRAQLAGDTWPDQQMLRQGNQAIGWVFLNRVPLGYEVWRRLNGFPPVLAPPSKESGGKESKPPKVKVG